jgi:hypothetical protein
MLPLTAPQQPASLQAPIEALPQEQLPIEQEAPEPEIIREVIKKKSRIKALKDKKPKKEPKEKPQEPLSYDEVGELMKKNYDSISDIIYDYSDNNNTALTIHRKMQRLIGEKGTYDEKYIKGEIKKEFKKINRNSLKKKTLKSKNNQK